MGVRARKGLARTFAPVTLVRCFAIPLLHVVASDLFLVVFIVTWGCFGRALIVLPLTFICPSARSLPQARTSVFFLFFSGCSFHDTFALFPTAPRVGATISASHGGTIFGREFHARIVGPNAIAPGTGPLGRVQVTSSLG